MSRRALLSALILAVAGAALPVNALGRLLAGDGNPLLPAVVTGMWVLKAMIVVHAALVGVAARFPLEAPGTPAGVAGTGGDHGESGRDVAWVVALLAVALVVRLVALGRGLWFDEIQTLVDYVRLPLGRIYTTYDSQNQHLLYSLAAGAVRTVAGESPALLRLPAVLFGLGSLWVVYRFGRLVTDRREAVLATALLALSYHHVWFSQNARGYTGLLLFTLAGSGAFLRLLTGRYTSGWRTATLYGVCMGLAAYTHITAILTVVAHFAIWVVAAIGARRHGRTRAVKAGFAGLLLATSVTLLLYAPVLPQVLLTVTHPPRGAAPTAWQSPLWFLSEAVRGFSRGVPGGWITLAAAAAVTATGLGSYLKRSPAASALMVLPAIVSGGAILALEHNLWPRFFFFSAGFVVLIAFRGGFALANRLLPERARVLGTVGAMAVVAGSAATIPRAWQPKQDYSGAAAWLEREKGPADAVVTVDLTRYPYQAYYHKPYTPVASLDSLTAIEAEHPRTWVLYTFPIRLAVTSPEIWQRLQSRYHQAAVFPGTVGGGAIVVMAWAPPPDSGRQQEVP